ncbi:MAG: glycosyltransferase [Solobacterium sp.]|nr:glycosyltransferase [Solobacterium sp.]
MKVALINSVAGFGSTGRIVDALASLEGIQGKIYYGRKENLAKAETFRMTHFLGNVHHVIQTFLFDTHGFHNQEETKKLIADLKEFQPDVIHLHNLHGYYLNVELLFAYLKETKTKVIWTLHDCWTFTGHCAHYEAIECEKWKVECKDCPALRQYPSTWNGSHVKDNYYRKKEVFTSLPIEQLTIVTPSEWLKAQVKQSFLKDYEVKVIPTGIDLMKFKPIKSSFRKENHLEDKTVLLAVSSVWTKEKGLSDLQALSHRLKENEIFVVVGISEKQKKGFNERNTILIQRTNAIQELCALYSMADVLLNLTYQDTFPTVNIEALACGCPVLTYQTGGSPEILDENTGWVVEKGNLDKVQEVINQLEITNKEKKKQMCVEKASYYTVDRMLKAYQVLYLGSQND